MRNGWINSIGMIEITTDYNGRIRHLRNGNLHRADGPAVIWEDGGEEWYFNGFRHRLVGPAIDYPNGYRAYYRNGRFHRSDGPAVISEKGYHYWYLDGVSLSYEEFEVRSR